MRVDHRLHASLDSTQDEARRLALAGVRGPLLVQALSQTRGRGRGANLWLAPPGGVYTTLLLSEPIAEAGLAWLPMFSCLAWVEVLESATLQHLVQIKWPNDLFLNGRKLGGQLVERLQVEGAGELVLVGTGLNVHKPQGISEAQQSLVRRATSLEMEIGPAALALDPAELALRWAHAFLTFLAIAATPNFEPKLLARVEPLLWARGCTVRVGAAEGQPWTQGVLLGLGRSGTARLRTPEGNEELVVSGHLEIPAWP